jgi:threonine/homoserine/homoserine lactone efflux protein
MDINSLIMISLACAAGAISPGPSLIVVIRNTIAGGRKQGVMTAIGHGIGLGLYALIAKNIQSVYSQWATGIY